jgi:hypothetical protein
MLALESSTRGLPKIWQRILKAVPNDPLAAKKLAVNQTRVRAFHVTNIFEGQLGGMNQTDP